MNLLASYKWLKDYVDLKDTPEEIAARVSVAGHGIEKLYPQGNELEGIVIGHVLTVEPHPNADKLRLASVDVGQKKPASIVCGGSNLMPDQWVAVALPGALVRWHGEGEPIMLELTEIRGVKSEGMICAANEISLFDAFPHAEREILDLKKHLPDLKVKPGTPLAIALNLKGDTLMDVEVTTNRPDVLGMVGFAREVATIMKRPFLWKPSKLPTIKGKAKLTVTIQAKKFCPRYMAVKMDEVTVKESPWWLKQRLIGAGLRPINNVVDITNYVMLELAQPMHAFDADKLEIKDGALNIEVRLAKQGEQLAALDGRNYDLTTDNLVIADANKPIALAGIMGGENTAVSGQTQSIIFEAASFDPVSVRRTARALNVYSDAQQRFEKGLSSVAPEIALARAIELCEDLAGGKVVSVVVDKKTQADKPAKYSITTDEISALIGMTLKQADIVNILKRLGFIVKTQGKKLTAVVPWWRDHDIEGSRDLVEEVARMYGYAHLPVHVPAGVPTQALAPELSWERDIKQTLKGAGFTETMSYSFVSAKMMERCNYEISHLLKISNPLSEDFEYMRTSLLPSMIQTVAENEDQFREQALFEIAKVYYPKKADWSDLPDEQSELAIGVLSDDQAWKKLKGAVEFVLSHCGITPTWKSAEQDEFWHPTRSAQAFVDDILVATIGEIHPAIAENWKIQGRLALADIPLIDVIKKASKVKRYQPTALFPSSKRDIALIVDRDATVTALTESMEQASTLLRHIEWFDTYMGEHVETGKKSIAFHLTFGLPDRTLTTDEVEQAITEIKKNLETTFGAKTRE